MQRSISAILKEHDDGMKVLTKKQDDLWNAKEKDFTKWCNPDLMRMTPDDQMELLRDVRNKQLIDPETQRQLWRLRQTHAFLAATLNEEMSVNQQWAVLDMRHNFTNLTKFMKEASLDTNRLWDDFEHKIFEKPSRT
jgi:Mg2+/Co2+ transporter CorC